MDAYEQFRAHIKRVAEDFKTSPFDTVRIISHLDSDGISAASILIKSLNRLNKKYTLSIVQQLDGKFLEQLAKENNRCVFFTDIGSGQISIIDKNIECTVFILDHHEMEKHEAMPNLTGKLFHINPHLFGIDGAREISGAGVVYLFAEAVDAKNRDMAHIAIIGAVGDVQENNGFLKLNNEILETAVFMKKIKVENGLRLFGVQSKPLHKLLEHSREHNIPGVSGSESRAIQFLHQLDINPKEGGKWKRFQDLNEDDSKNLIAGLLLKRSQEKNPEGIIGPVYHLCEEENGPMKDVKEFSTLLNACGRLERASIGIGICLGDKKMKKKSEQVLADYRKELMKALEWCSTAKEGVIEEEGFVLINAETNVMPTLIGTIASLISKSKTGKLVLSMARCANGATKVSLRLNENDVNLFEVISEIAHSVGGQAGGHKNAAGAMIKTESEGEFIQNALSVMRKLSLEEKI